MERKKIESYKDLVVWEKGIALVNDLYTVSNGFPKEELFGLTSQLRRAGVSVPDNIAEGWGRNSTKNYIQFIRISRGSVYEIETLLIIAKNQHYITQQTKAELSDKLDEVGKMLNTLLKSLEKYIDE